MIPRIKIEHSAIVGDAVRPVSEDWIDLASTATPPVTIAPDAVLGLHDYTYDVAVGPKGDTTVWAHDAAGLYLSVNSALTYRGLCVLPITRCSLRYDPYFEWVIYTAASTSQILTHGLVSEAVGDYGTVHSDNTHRSCLFSAGVLNIQTRASSATNLGAAFLAGHYYRMRLDPEDGGRVSMYDLGTVAPTAPYTGGTMVYDAIFSKGKRLIGGNVIALAFGARDVGYWRANRILACRTTLRNP